MSSDSSINGSLAIPFPQNVEFSRILPEPQSRVGNAFTNVLKTAASSLLDGGSDMLGINSEYSSLLQMQIEAQKELQVVSMVSNVEKSKHETQMAAIRNIRVG